MTDFAKAAYGVRDIVLAKKAENAKVTRQPGLRASGFWPCDRNMYYQVKNWSDRVVPSAEKQCLFDFGKAIEEIAIDDLRQAGFKITRQQVAMEVDVKGGVISGHLDGWISGHDITEPVLLEIKGYLFGAAKFKHWREMLDAPQPWIRAVPNQLQLYLTQANLDKGLLVLYAKESGQIYSLPVRRNRPLRDELVARAEHVYDCLAREDPPEPAPYDSKVCGVCDWVHICRPFLQLDVSASGQIFDEAMEATAVEYLATLQDSKLNKAVGDELKAWAKGIAAEHKLTEIILGEIALLEVHQTEKRTLVKIKPQESNNSG